MPVRQTHAGARGHDDMSQCGGAFAAAVTEPAVARRILECLGLPPRGPLLAPASGPKWAPALWLEERPADPDANERLAARLAKAAQDVGAGADAVEVHMEGALDAAAGWSDAAAADVRPVGVSVHFTYDIPILFQLSLNPFAVLGAGPTQMGLEDLPHIHA